MINTDPLKALLIDRNISITFISQASGLSKGILKSILRGRSIRSENLNLLCSVLNCQPCDIIEWKPDSNLKGHWVYLED